MPTEGMLALAITGVVIAALATNKVSVEAGMLGGLLALILVGAVSPERALAGFAHPAVIAISSLFVVAATLFSTGATSSFVAPLLGLPKSVRIAQLRLTVPVALLSSCINNTPVVAMYVPIVQEWSRRIRVSSSKLLIPLSFASLLGGQLTLIGSASNLIVMGLYVEYLDSLGLARPSSLRQFWAPAMLGLPVLTVGLAYLVGISSRLLPERRKAATDRGNVRQYSVQMHVPKGSRAEGKALQRLGLRHLPGLDLYAVEREGEAISSPSTDMRLAAGDRLYFVGAFDAVVDLQKVYGLVPSHRHSEDSPGQPAQAAELVEVVVSHDSPVVGKIVRNADFRGTYDAGVVGVHRCGEPVLSPIEDVEIQEGDTLMLDAPEGFEEDYRSSGDFCLVAKVPGYEHPNHAGRRKAVAVCGVLGFGIMFSDWPPMVVCLGAALLMVFLGCIPPQKAFLSIPLRVIATIGAALGLAVALEDSGAAQFIADKVLDFAEGLGVGNRGMVLGIVATASAFAQVINKNGAAAMMFPVAMAAAARLNVHPEPFAFSLIVGCGLSFMSPVSYNTNLMVYAPGGYKFTDYPRVGFPMTVLLVLLVSWLCPVAFPFRPLP